MPRQAEAAPGGCGIGDITCRMVTQLGDRGYKGQLRKEDFSKFPGKEAQLHHRLSM